MSWLPSVRPTAGSSLNPRKEWFTKPPGGKDTSTLLMSLRGAKFRFVVMFYVLLTAGPGGRKLPLGTRLSKMYNWVFQYRAKI